MLFPFPSLQPRGSIQGFSQRYSCTFTMFVVPKMNFVISSAFIITIDRLFILILINNNSYFVFYLKLYSKIKMRKIVTEIKPIAPRANMKYASVGKRQFLIGGMTADKVSCDIFEFRTIQQEGQYKIQWKPLKFQNHIFTPRNSFSVCASETKIYIWGGLQTQGMDQKCLSDLIEVDVDTCKMKKLPLQQKISIHSALLTYDKQNNQLVAFGGTNESSSKQSLLYSLNLNEGEETYSWNIKKLSCPQYKGILWQHTGHLTKKSFFTQSEGKFLTIIGGCKEPQSPWKVIVEFDLIKMEMTNKKEMKSGLVSHDSFLHEDCLFIHGGSTGGDFNKEFMIFSKGEMKYMEGHNSVGGICFVNDKCIFVIGGVSGPMNINGIIAYPQILK